MSPKTEEIIAIIDKSKRAIASAENELMDGNFDFSCSRAYYSVFYLLEGVLLLDEKSFSKHSGVISSINHDYIRKGIFPAHISKSIKTLLKRREMADYSFSIRMTKEDAAECLAMAKELFTIFSEYLRREVLNDTGI